MNKPNFAILRPVLAILMMISTGPIMAEVYKTVDKDGNVVYTDKPPAQGAQPMELPGLSIVESAPTAPRAGTASVPDSSGPEAMSIREMRRLYRDFAITKPQQDEYIQGTGNRVTVSWGSRSPLQPGMMVVPTIDGRQYDPVQARSITLDQMDRGEHVASARLVDAEGRTIANASPVTFFVRQFSVNFRTQPPPAPGGG